VYTIADSNFKIAGVGDFQGDRRADILFRHQTSGDLFQWLMNGALIGTSRYLYTVADPNFAIVSY